MNGKDAISTPQVEAGDIGALTKLATTQTGDTLCDRDAPIQLPGVEFPKFQYLLCHSPDTRRRR